MSESVPEAGAPAQPTAVEPEPQVTVPESGPSGVPSRTAGPEGEEARDTVPDVEPACDPAGPAPLDVPRTPTGNADVDAQLERLTDADHLATDGHVEVYEDVHRGLRDALTALDARPGPPAPPTTYGTRS
ncbi:hypothetical protein [Streptomyces sp. Tue6028]|uniref:hypothetical protein n=1 Tax=Streptomyces sp. Tue6028 TaxID=2036037 RepID=UPI0015CE5EAE|nr:hypothetical protein [Streptomyces sp. Tue6028]